MIKHLMTWYGTTDLRASLGLEQSTRPVLGALLAEDYTDVIILGFTHPKKSKNKSDGFQQSTGNIKGSDTAAAREIVDLFSNSVEAHSCFTQWLEKQLRAAGKKVNVHFRPAGLKHLNDTEGIYEAATQSLNYVIECKAGNVTGEHVMKFQNIGIEDRAVLASCFYPKNNVVKKKIDDSKNLLLVSGNSLFRQLEEMIQPRGRH